MELRLRRYRKTGYDSIVSHNSFHLTEEFGGGSLIIGEIYMKASCPLTWETVVGTHGKGRGSGTMTFRFLPNS